MKAKGVPFKTSYKLICLYLQEYPNLGMLHGCHYVPLLILVLFDLFQEKPYQIHHHPSTHKGGEISNEKLPTSDLFKFSIYLDS